MTGPRIGDLIIQLTTVTGQLVIARLYVGRWRQRLTMTQRRAVVAALGFLWFCCAVDITAQNIPMHFLRWVPAWVRGVAYAIGTTWGVTSAASLILNYLVTRVANAVSPAESPARRAALRTAIAAPFAAVAFGGIVERTNFHVREIDLPVPNLHPDLENFRIVQISDLHVSPFLSVRQAGRVVDMANELRAHLAVVTGDLISEVGDPLDETIRELARLRADTGVLGCMGNHELYARAQQHTKREAAKYGIEFLRHEARQLRWGNGLLNVAGVDYQNSQNKPIYLRGAEQLIVPGVPNLLLSHNPDVFPVAVAKGYDAMLAGHTHGGQVTVEIFSQTANFARFVTRYVRGLYRIDGRSCYVTPGIGTIGMPVRLGARPEISLLRLKRA